MSATSAGAAAGVVVPRDEARSRKAIRPLPYIAGNSAALLVGLFSAYFALTHGTDTRPLRNHDFLVYYGAARMILEGHAGAVYSLPAMAHLETVLVRPLSMMGSVNGYVYPPFFALILVPLSAMPYTAALVLWFAINCVLLSASMYLLEQYSGLTGRAAILWRFGSICSLPVLLTLVFGQVSMLFLFLLAYGLHAARQGRNVALGVALGLALIKPTYAVPFVVVLLCRRMWTALGAMAGTGLALLVLPLPVFGPAGDLYYVKALLQVDRWQGTAGLITSHHLIVVPALYQPSWNDSFAGFVQLLLPLGPANAINWIVAVLTVVLVGLCAVTCRDIALPWALATVAALWASGHTLSYDLTLLLIPCAVAILYRRTVPRVLPLLLIAVYLLVSVGYRLVFVIHLQLSTIALFALGAWLCYVMVSLARQELPTVPQGLAATQEAQA